MQATLVAPERPHAGEESRAALAVAVVAAIGLLLGWLLMTSIEGRSSTFNGLNGGLSLSYPSSWTEGKAEDGTLLSVSEPVPSGAFRPQLKVYTRTLPQGQRLLDAATIWTLGRMNDLREFRDLGTEETTLAGQPALKVNYGYIADPPAGAGPATLPIVVRACDTIVVQGKQYVVFSAVSDAGMGEIDAQLTAILASVKLSGK